MTVQRRPMRLALGPGRSPEDDATSIPYPDLSGLQKEAIEDAIREAWTRLPTEAALQGLSLDNMDETPLNRLLQDELEKLRTDPARPIPEFNDEVFTFVTEGEGQPDQTGQPLDENTGKPDLLIRPHKPPSGVARPRTYGMHVECKLIERGHESRTIASYCKEGILRFVAGEYASTMPSGLMVAYLRRTKARLPDALTDYLQTYNPQKWEVQALPALSQNRSNQRAPSVYLSKHERSKVRVGAKGRNPGPIELTHLWLVIR